MSSGGSWDGYSDYGPGEVLPPDVAAVFPPLGHEVEPPTTLVYGPPDEHGNRQVTTVPDPGASDAQPRHPDTGRFVPRS